MSIPEPYKRTSLSPGLGERNIQRPLLPAHILVCLSEEVRLSPALFEELHDKLSPPSLLMCSVYCPHQRNRPLVDQRFEINIVDRRQGEVEEVTGEG